MMSRNKNGGDSWGTLYREPMGKLVLHYKKSKNLSGEEYIQSSNTNLPRIIKTSQIERLSKTHAFALDDCICASPEILLNFFIHSKTITSS